MSEQLSFNDVDALLFQLALETRELSHKKNEVKQQIQGCRADIAERRSHIETLKGNFKKLTEEINVKQSTILKNKKHAKSMKATNSHLLQYKETLKAELESRKVSYNHDLEVYEERLSSYRMTFESYKESYLQNPLAKKLSELHAENEEIKSRIKACNDQIMAKQEKLEHLADLAVNSVSTGKRSDSVFGEQLATEEQSERQTKEDRDSSVIDVSSKDLNRNENEAPVEANYEIHEQNKVQVLPSCLTSPEKAKKELWSYQQMEVQRQPEEVESEAQIVETSEENLILEEQMAVLDVDGGLEDKMENGAPIDEEQAQTEEHHQKVTVHRQTSQEANPQTFSGKASLASTSTFAFNFSPTSSPRRVTLDTKSPAFQFTLNSNTSTPGFPGFGFDMGSSQEEDSSFAFTGSLFNEKKATEASPSSYPEFLFDQPQKGDDFQFAFSARSPQSASNEKKDEFPFSFNF